MRETRKIGVRVFNLKALPAAYMVVFDFYNVLFTSREVEVLRVEALSGFA